jgi:hypothetical protein
MFWTRQQRELPVLTGSKASSNTPYGGSGGLGYRVTTGQFLLSLQVASVDKLMYTLASVITTF